ncbi:MAG: V-type ATPase 116kDa subunit family protein [Sedimentisphaerales bacterium]|jgi:V/A-type H+-transporting ATPase subunit I
MFTTEMVQLFAVVLGKDSDRVSEALLREGVMQFIDISEIEVQKPDHLPAAKAKISLAEISELRKRIEGFLYAGGIVPSAPKETDLLNRKSIDVEKERSHVDQIDGERESLRERQRTLQQELLKLEDIRRQVERYGTGLVDVAVPARHSFISMQIGKLPASNVEQFEDGLKDLPSLNISMGQETDVAHQLLISMKRDGEQIQKLLTKVGWTRIEPPDELRSVKKDVFKELSEKLKTLSEEQLQVEKKIHDLVKNEEKRLMEVWINLRVNELIHLIQGNFKSSARTAIFTGWLPSSKKDRLTHRIKEACENRCYLEWNEARSQAAVEGEVPVRFNNPKFLGPFQMLVSNFGVPEYGTIDPTPFVMPLYLSMFGLMFADVGQGLVLVLLGILGIFSLRKKEQKAGFYQLSWLIVWCGLSSVLFGALFGSCFGMRLFRPLWFDFHGIVSGHVEHESVVNDVFDVLAITLYFGIAVIFLGLLFNWINIVRTRKNWMEFVFDKGGILGGWIYGGGIYIAAYMVAHDYKQFPPSPILFILAGLPALLLFVREPYHYLKHGKGPSDKGFSIFTVLNFIMGWLVELLEIFSGYLSNTLSFMRVAGLGIAHVCLMISFFTLAGMTSGFFSVFILVLGNILVIGLEGLSAGVQALRLNYYEFFTKFFHGTGKLYTPISLNSSHR